MVLINFIVMLFSDFRDSDVSEDHIDSHVWEAITKKMCYSSDNIRSSQTHHQTSDALYKF